MRIVCSLYEPAMDINLIKVKQQRRNTSAGERQSSSSSASSPPQTQSRILSNHEEPLSSPSQLVSSVFDVFKPIWDALQSWFDLLNLEISKTDPEHGRRFSIIIDSIRYYCDIPFFTFQCEVGNLILYNKTHCPMIILPLP